MSVRVKILPTYFPENTTNVFSQEAACTQSDGCLNFTRTGSPCHTSEKMLCSYRITALLSRFFIYFKEQHQGLIKLISCIFSIWPTSISVHFTKSDYVIHIQLVSYIVIINIQSNWFTKKYKPRQYGWRVDGRKCSHFLANYN